VGVSLRAPAGAGGGAVPDACADVSLEELPAGGRDARRAESPRSTRFPASG